MGIRLIGPGRSGGIPLPLTKRAPETAPRWNGPLLQILMSVLRRLVFFNLNPPSVRFGTIAAVIRITAADRLAQAFQPMTCPRKFDAQYREPHGNDNNRRSRRHDHHDTYQHDGRANHANDDATGCLIGEVHDSLDQNLPRWYCICRTVT